MNICGFYRTFERDCSVDELVFGGCTDSFEGESRGGKLHDGLRSVNTLQILLLQQARLVLRKFQILISQFPLLQMSPYCLVTTLLP